MIPDVVIWQLMDRAKQIRIPVAVPAIFVADGAAASAGDRCHSLTLLYPPQTALGSLPLILCRCGSGGESFWRGVVGAAPCMASTP